MHATHCRDYSRKRTSTILNHAVVTIVTCLSLEQTSFLQCLHLSKTWSLWTNLMWQHLFSILHICCSNLLFNMDSKTILPISSLSCFQNIKLIILLLQYWDHTRPWWASTFGQHFSLRLIWRKVAIFLLSNNKSLQGCLKQALNLKPQTGL